MLGFCTQRLKASETLVSPSWRKPSLVGIPLNGAKSTQQISTSKPVFPSPTATLVSLYPVNTFSGRYTVRSYSRKVDTKLTKAEKLQKKAESLAKRAEHYSERTDLNQFFSPDQKTGETRVVKNTDVDEDEWDLDEMPAEVRADYEEEQIRTRALRSDHEATQNEIDMAMGLSSYRPVDRKALHKPAKTVALSKLAAEGKLELSDLADLDYDTLKSFVTKHEIAMEDFFTRARTSEGEFSEVSAKLGGGDDDFDEMDPETLIENSREYLKSRRNNPSNFRDRIRVRCMAGSGGKGGLSFYRDTRVQRGPPDGGDGGDGGSVIFVAAENKKPSLASLQPSYRAASGQPGSRTRRRGKNGADIIIEVPLGTTITEFKSKPAVEEDVDSSSASGELRAPTTAETFMTPKNKFRGDVEGEETVEFHEPADLDSLSPEERIWELEQAHKRRIGDPREGRPWAPPELPESHPLQSSATEFHRMISDYEYSKSTLNAEQGSTVEDMMQAAEYAKQQSAKKSSSTSFRASSAGKSIIAASPMLEQYAMEEGELDGEYDGFSQDFVTGTDLVDKYRLQPPNASTTPKASNLPRSVDLDEAGAYFIAAKGGAGGLGNFRLAASRNRPQGVSTPGKNGESIIYQLELKLIADVGLVGFPNAGKSTFLSNVSRANPKIASYPFTTLCPEIGTVHLDDVEESQFTIADLPGLIEGAHRNRGLGHQFLKHIERTSVLAYVIDMSGGDNREPWKSFTTLWDELEMYQSGLVKKPSIIIANKMDAGTVAHNNLTSFAKKIKGDKTFKHLKIYPVSAASKMNVVSVINGIRQLLGMPMPTRQASSFKRRVHRAREEGIVTMNIGSHLSEALRNIK